MKFKLFLFFLSLTICSSNLLAQSLSDIGKVNVDMLSDQQLQEMLQRATLQGLNASQVVTMARERGMAAGEVAKLQQRLTKLNQGGIQNTPVPSFNERVVLGTQTEAIQVSPANLTPYQQKIFGFSLFFNKDLNFNPSLSIPTPQSYVLGAGDQLLIDVYGASQQSYDLKVSPEGKILIPNVGFIEVGGATVGAATSRIKTSLGQIYSGLNSGISFLEVRLGNIRTVSVALVGDINQPGNYTLPAFASPFNALFAAGGPNENGSFRHIQVYRNNKLLIEIDIYDFLIKGTHNSSITLNDNDVLIVPPARIRVELTGPIRREGFFELKPTESLGDLIRFAGGFRPEAYQGRITLSRKTGSEMRIEEISESNFSSFIPRDGDSYQIEGILNRYENRVQVTGALMRPGTFGLLEGMKINDLIKKAEGLREDAFLNRATLYRTKPDFSLEIVAVNIGAIVRGEEQDIVLQREDVLNIPSIYDLQEEYYVKISGEINNPGAFAFGANMRVSDLVLKAGGFTEAAMATQIEVVRRVRDDVSGKLAEIIQVSIDKDLKMTAAGSDLQLKPFDHVLIRRSPGYQREKLVRVEGEVYYPGEYALANANERISDLLKRSGGINQFAYVKGATLIRRNEFFASPSENAITVGNLAGVKANATQDEKNNTESEKILLSRIDSKISQKAISKDEATQTVKADEFKKETIENVALKEGLGTEAAVRSEEMVGIDLGEILMNPGGKNDLILQEGDVLSIPKELQTVRMRGELLFPTTTRFEEGAPFRKYISRAGGFTDRSRKVKSYVVYANGNVARTSRLLFFYFYPSIQPGAEIVVPTKPEREGVTAQGWIGIGTSLATLGLLINQLIPAN
jgi:protein involved in polysaccharide export with SLBB domain